MAELLEQTLSPAVMNSAWRRLSSDKTVWVPGLPRWDMERHLVRHILELVDDVRTGRYRPAPIRQFTITKGDGKKRVLSALSLRDKLLQRAVLTVLEPMAEALFHNDSFGYRPGRNTDLAIQRVRERVQCGLTWLVDADIQSFFDSIPHRELVKILRKTIPDRQLLDLIELWLAESGSVQGFMGRRRGILQGAVISPLLCNLYLHQFDTALAGRNIPFVRFADDFLLFAPDKNRAERAMHFGGKKLEELGLVLHPEKTAVVQSSGKLSFLGHRLPDGDRNAKV